MLSIEVGPAQLGTVRGLAELGGLAARAGELCSLLMTSAAIDRTLTRDRRWLPAAGPSVQKGPASLVERDARLAMAALTAAYPLVPGEADLAKALVQALRSEPVDTPGDAKLVRAIQEGVEAAVGAAVILDESLPERDPASRQCVSMHRLVHALVTSALREGVLVRRLSPMALSVAHGNLRVAGGSDLVRLPESTIELVDSMSAGPSELRAIVSEGLRRQGGPPSIVRSFGDRVADVLSAGHHLNDLEVRHCPDTASCLPVVPEPLATALVLSQQIFLARLSGSRHAN